MPVYNNARSARVRSAFRKGKRRREEPIVRQIFRENLKGCRLLRGLSQRGLAEAAGAVSQAWIQQLEAESDDALPPLTFIETVATALGCTMADLLVPGKFREGLKLERKRRAG